jgi:inhibitor of cysteine peptidase
MKRTIVFGLITVLLLPLLVIGCTGEPPGPGSVVLTTNDFTADNHIKKTIEVSQGNSLTIDLSANPSTGYQWSENTEISDAAVIRQVDHNYISPETSTIGAPGKEVWVFDCMETGKSTIKLSYGRPWEEGEQNTWTLTVNVIVK